MFWCHLTNTPRRCLGLCLIVGVHQIAVHLASKDSFLFCLGDYMSFGSLLYSVVFSSVRPWVTSSSVMFALFGAFKLEQLDRKVEWLCVDGFYLETRFSVLGLICGLPSWTFLSWLLIYASTFVCLILLLIGYWRTVSFASVQPWASCGCESCLVTAGGQWYYFNDSGSVSWSLGGMVACSP